MTFEESAEDLTADVASLGFDLTGLIARKKIVIDHVRVSGTRSRRRANTIWRGSSSAWVTRSRRSRPSGSCWTPSRRSSRDLQPGHPARRAAAPLQLAQGPGHHRGHHRRAGRGHPHPARARGVRLRLRDLARPPRRRPGLDPPAAGRQVPRLEPRDQRVPVPDRAGRHQRAADHLARPRARGPGRARLDRLAGSTTCSAARASTGQQRPALRHRRHRQDEPRRALRRRGLRRGERCLLLPFEESPQQYMRNMRSIGIDLEPWVKEGLPPFPFRAPRPARPGDSTWWQMHQQVEGVRARGGRGGPDQQPHVGRHLERGQGDAVRLVDHLKTPTSPRFHQPHHRRTRTSRPTIGDLLADRHVAPAARPREGRSAASGLYVLKSRGMAHSNDVSTRTTSPIGASQLVRTVSRPVRRRRTR